MFNIYIKLFGHEKNSKLMIVLYNALLLPLLQPVTCVKCFFSWFFCFSFFFFNVSYHPLFIILILIFKHFWSFDSKKYKKITILLMDFLSHNIFFGSNFFSYLFYFFYFLLLYLFKIWKLILLYFCLQIVLTAIFFLVACAIES